MLRTFYNEITLIAFLVASFLVAGCGKTDPVSEYGLKAVPKHGQKTEEPKEPRSPFVFEVPNGTIPDFVEGQPGSAHLRVRVTDQNVTGYSLEAIELPPGAKLHQVDFENWELRWTPTQAIGANAVSATYKVSVEIWVTEASDERYKKLNRKPHSLNVNVRREGLPPQRVNLPAEPNFVRLGEKLPFTIELEDKMAGGTQAPEFSVLPSRSRQNAEFHKSDGSSYVKLVSSERLQNGNWRYSFEFDTSDGSFPSLNRKGARDNSIEETTAAFSLKFKSPSKLTSPDYDYFFRVLFRASKPELKGARSKVTVGRPSLVSFNVQVPSERGRLTVDAAATELKSFPGAPELNCKPAVAAKPTNVRCTMNWTIDCSAGTATRYEIKIKAVHEVAGEKIESDLIQEIDIERSDKICKPAAPPPSETSKKKSGASK